MRIGRNAEERLQIAYVVAFAVVLALVAAVVFVAFRATIRAQVYERLDALARNAFDQVHEHDGRLEIESDANDLASPDRLLARREVVEWFIDGRLRRRIGIALPPRDRHHLDAADEEYFVRTLASRERGFSVRVAEAADFTQAPLRQIAIGLSIGWFVTSLGAGVFGNILGRRVFATLESAARRQGEFVADASHELRGPLTVITTNASSILRDETYNDPRIRARLENIMDAARQMDRLAARLLMLARLDSVDVPARATVDLRSLVRAIIAVYHPLAGERELRFDEPSGEPIAVAGDPDDLRRIVENIVENAIAYTPERGRITVTTGIDGGGPFVTIEDTGIGIAGEDLPRIFDRFWRGDEARGSATSAGLGLAIVQRLAARNGAQIDVTSELGSGTTFTVRFKAASRTAAADSPAGIAAEVR